MDDKVKFNDLFELLSAELSVPAETLKTLVLKTDGGLARLVADMEAMQFDGKLTLAEPIVTVAGGHPLIAANVALTLKTMSSLLSRQMSDPSSTVGPVSLAFDEAAIAHYRGKIKDRFQSIISNIKLNPNPNIRTLHQNISNHQSLKDINDTFGKVVDGIISDPRSIIKLLKVITGKESGVLASSADSSIVALAVRSLYGRHLVDERTREDLMNVGMAALLQDISLALPGAVKDEHHLQSSKIIEELGLPAEVAELVLNHHRIEEGQFDASQPGGFRSVNEAVLISSNVFVSEIKEGSIGSNFETIKNLNYLAQQGLIDYTAMKAFASLYVPKLQVLIIEKTQEIKKACLRGPANPILWPISGDKLPSVFLCNRTDCPQSTPQISIMATDIPFVHNGKVLAVIKKGEYFTCPLCTGWLKKLYEKIKEQMARE